MLLWCMNNMQRYRFDKEIHRDAHTTHTHIHIFPPPSYLLHFHFAFAFIDTLTPFFYWNMHIRSRKYGK